MINDLNFKLNRLCCTYVMLCYAMLSVTIQGSIPSLILLQCNRKKPKKNEKRKRLNFYNCIVLIPEPALPSSNGRCEKFAPLPAQCYI